jgi:hypothetical protein
MPFCLCAGEVQLNHGNGEKTTLEEVIKSRANIL